MCIIFSSRLYQVCGFFPECFLLAATFFLSVSILSRNSRLLWSPMPPVAMKFCRNSKSISSTEITKAKAGFGVLTYSLEAQFFLRFALLRKLFATLAMHLKRFCSGCLICCAALKRSPLFTYLLFYSRSVYWVLFIWQQVRTTLWVYSLLLKQKIKQRNIILYSKSFDRRNAVCCRNILGRAPELKWIRRWYLIGELKDI